MFLLTDGDVWGQNELFDEVYAHNKDTRVHAIGIGNGVGEELIVGIAKAGNGAYDFVKDSNQESITATALSMVQSAISPTLNEFSLKFSS